MNKIDLFDPEYITSMISENLFGIQDERPACITLEGEHNKWNAVVDNSQGFELAFVALDHNIVIHPTPETTYSLCDCMLYREGHWMTLVELKDQAKGWLENAIDQLKSTIEIIKDNPKTADYPHREVYAANLRFPSFKFSKKSRMNEFRKETKFRLIITNKIKAK